MKTLRMPFRINNGRSATLSDMERIIQQKIVDVLVTFKRERVMRPNYGSSIYAFLYEPIDPLIWADFKTEAMIDLSESVTGATIVDIVISSTESLMSSNVDNTTINVTVYYRLPPNQIATMTFSVSEFLTEESTL